MHRQPLFGATLFAVIVTSFMTATLAARGQQPLPQGIRSQDQASQGKTDVASEGFAAPAEELEETDAADASEAEVSAGGLIATGNSEQMALTSSANARLRREASQFTSAAAVNFARAASGDSDELETTVENMQGKLRYDYFFAKHWSAFLSVSGRRDRFQGLNLRLNVDPGVAHYFIDEAAHQLWIEAGYDLQYDIRRDETLDDAEASGEERPDDSVVRHSVRGFAGYDNQINERVSFSTGLEYIQSVQQADTWRLNWDGAIRSNIAGNFSTAVTMRVTHDNNPLPGVDKLDVLTSFNLVYALL